MEDKKVSEIYVGVLDSDGVYPVDVNVGNFDSVLITFSDAFEDIRDTALELTNTKSLIPHLKSYMDQGYVVSSSSSNGGEDPTTIHSPYRAFDGSAQYHAPHIGWLSGAQSLPAWLQIQKTDGKIRTNMFTIYQGRNDYHTQYTTSIHCQIQGSNDGVNWDVLVDDATPVVAFTKSTTYHLDDYVEYSYYRAVILDGYVYWDGNKYWAITEFLIQDSAIHGHGQHTPVEVVKSGNGDDAVFDTVSPYGTVRLTNDTLELQNLTRKITSIYGLSSQLDTYRLYRKGTDGTPTLFMPDQTTIGSSLGTVDLSTDLASLASKEYVADEVDKFSRSNLAGKVDTYEDLPIAHVIVPWVAPSLTSNGTPYVDEYAISSTTSVRPDEVYVLTYSDGNEHQTYPLPGYVYMTFNQPINVTKMKVINRPMVVGSWGYHINEYSVDAKTSAGEWIELIHDTSDVQGFSETWEVDISNTEYYHEYRIHIRSAYDGSSAGYCILDMIQLSGNSTIPKEDIRPGTMYLVGTEGNLEEYILTEWGTWERMGEIRQSDVDLSGYTTTEGMISFIGASSDHMGTNIETMRTDIQSYLDTLESGINTSILELPLDSQFQDSVPIEWDSKLSDRAMLFVTEPDTVPYTAPELRDGDGVPFVDEYAVSISSSLNHEQYPAHEATYTPDVLDEHHTWSSGNIPPPHYYYMTFKEPMRATHLFVKNRYMLSNDVYAPKLFVVEGKNSSGEWHSIHTCYNPNAASNAEYEFSFENDMFYQEYRLKLLESHGGSSGYNYVCLNVVRLSGEIKKA